MREAHDDISLNVLRNASVVGMTTAGVASNQMLVRALDPRVWALLLVLRILQNPLCRGNQDSIEKPS